MLKKYGNLEMSLIHKVRREYASYRGWFKEYTGFLKDDYEDKKDDRMKEKINTFYENWRVEDNMSQTKDIGKALDVHHSTILKYTGILLEQGKLIEGENFFVNNSGRKKYKKETIIYFDELQKELHKSKLANAKKNGFKAQT